MYESDKFFFAMMDEKCDQFSPIVKSTHLLNLDHIESTLNSHFEVLRTSVGLMRLHEFTGHNHSTDLLFATLHKNLFNFYSAIRLLERGLHGSAAIFLRPIFESLYLAKYCAIIDDTKVFERWSNGESLNLSNQVLNKIRNPALPASRELLKALHGYTHSSIFSQQVSLEPEFEMKQISIKIALITTLAVLSHHLLNRHYITKKFKYHLENYVEGDEFSQGLFESRVYASVLRGHLSKTGRQLYREYSAKWEIS